MDLFNANLPYEWIFQRQFTLRMDLFNANLTEEWIFSTPVYLQDGCPAGHVSVQGPRVSMHVLWQLSQHPRETLLSPDRVHACDGQQRSAEISRIVFNTLLLWREVNRWKRCWRKDLKHQ